MFNLPYTKYQGRTVPFKNVFVDEKIIRFYRFESTYTVSIPVVLGVLFICTFSDYKKNLLLFRKVYWKQF